MLAKLLPGGNHVWFPDADEFPIPGTGFFEIEIGPDIEPRHLPQRPHSGGAVTQMDITNFALGTGNGAVNSACSRGLLARWVSSARPAICSRRISASPWIIADVNTFTERSTDRRTDHVHAPPSRAPPAPSANPPIVVACGPLLGVKDWKSGRAGKNSGSGLKRRKRPLKTKGRFDKWA